MHILLAKHGGCITIIQRHRGRVVRAPDLRSEILDFCPILTTSWWQVLFPTPATLVNSQLICLLPVGIFNLFLSIYIVFFIVCLD